MVLGSSSYQFEYTYSNKIKNLLLAAVDMSALFCKNYLRCLVCTIIHTPVYNNWRSDEVKVLISVESIGKQ